MEFALGIFWVVAMLSVLGIVLTSSEREHHVQEQKAGTISSKQDDAAHQDKAKEHGGKGSRWAQYREKIEYNEKVITAVSTVFIAAFTIVLAFATGFLYIATRNLVESADETAQKQLRAYIGIHDMKVTVYPFEQGGFAFIAEAELRNFGQTPAYDMVVQCNAKVDVPDAIPFDASQGNAKSGGPTIAFRDTGLTAAQWERISEADKDAIFRREKIIFLWGTVRYRDAFDKRHYFTFRLVSGALVIGTGGVYNMSAHRLGIEGD